MAFQIAPPLSVAIESQNGSDVRTSAWILDGRILPDDNQFDLSAPQEWLRDRQQGVDERSDQGVAQQLNPRGFRPLCNFAQGRFCVLLLPQYAHSSCLTGSLFSSSRMNRHSGM